MYSFLKKNDYDELQYIQYHPQTIKELVWALLTVHWNSFLLVLKWITLIFLQLYYITVMRAERTLYLYSSVDMWLTENINTN